MKRNIFILALLTILITACGGGSSGNDSPAPAPVDNVPQVTNAAVLDIDGEAINPREGMVGDTVVLRASVRDNDRNARRLYVEYYHEDDDYAEMHSVEEYLIPPMSGSSFTYAFDDQPHTVTGPSGFWRMIIYIVDEEGNESDEFEIDYLVR